MEGEKNQQYKKGLWTEEEDKVLLDYVKVHGKGQWNRLAKKTGLKRCGKSCRLRWMNYLSPNVKRGDFSDEENDLIIRLHRLLGNRWSLIAGRVPGRTDNQVKNYWNTHLSKKLGLNKSNSAVVGQVSSQTSSMSVEKAPLEPSPNTISSTPYSCGSNDSPGAIETQEAIETQKAILEPEMHNTVFSCSAKDTFWGSSEELELSMASNLFEFLGDFSFDPSWNNL